MATFKIGDRVRLTACHRQMGYHPGDNGHGNSRDARCHERPEGLVSGPRGRKRRGTEAVLLRWRIGAGV